jgi:AcrR family transcriptional regulator
MGSLLSTHPRLEPLLEPRAAGQRARLLEGITLAVAEKGYAAATVADAVRHARVSRGTFYELFESKEACFLEAYRHGVDVMLELVGVAARAVQGSWEARLRASLRAYLEALSGEPLFARTYMLEIHAAGSRAQAERDAVLRRFAERYRACFEQALRERPGLRMPSDDLLFVLTAGIDQLVCARLREGSPPRLPELEDALVLSAVAMLEGVAAVHDPGGP